MFSLFGKIDDMVSLINFWSSFNYLLITKDSRSDKVQTLGQRQPFLFKVWPS